MRHDEIQDCELMSLDGELLISGTVRITRGLSLRLWTGQFTQYDGSPDFELAPGAYVLRHGSSVDRVELKRGFTHQHSPTIAPPRVMFNSVVQTPQPAEL